MSRQAVTVPDIGTEAADVIEILVKPGEVVGAEQPVVVLESDKASMELPCPWAGTVAEISVQVGQRVREGDVLLQLDTASMAEAGMIASARATAQARREVPVAALGEELHQVSRILAPGDDTDAAGGVATVGTGDAAGEAQAPAEKTDAAPVAHAGPDVGNVPVIVRVPDIGAESADVIEILVQPGDTLALEQAVVVLESAKASMEVPSPATGVVAKVLVKVGDKVSENSPLLELRGTPASQSSAPGRTTGDAGVARNAAPAPVASATATADSNAPEPAAGGEASRTDVPVAPASPATDTAAAPPAPGLHRAALHALATAVSQAAGATVHAGPAVRRLARELGVDLARVKGSGPRERILKEDVHGFVKQRLQQLEAGPAETGAAALPAIDFSRWGEVERVELGRIQRVSAQNLHRAWSVIPHVTQFDEADITALEEFRLRHKEAFRAEGLSLTLLSFLVRTTAHVLLQFPRFNSSLAPDGSHLVQKRYVHIGVAVDTPEGLVVPVIRDADRKSIRAIARELGELSAKARARKLTPAEMQGASFSISSLGGVGGTAFTPIVNWPEVAILGVSRAATKPVWDGQAFQPRLMLPLSLSYDHRVIDGAAAARFTTALATALGDLRELLL